MFIFISFYYTRTLKRKNMSAQRKLPLFPLAVLPLTLAAAFAHADGDTVVEGASLDTVYVTAEKQLQQSLGVSRISN